MPDRPTTRILFVGDMHLGCLPSRLPDGLGRDPELGPVGAWRRVVDLAMELGVQAVALAGDLVHQTNAAFGAYGPLEEGVHKLAAAGIPVCAVAGNHDAATLPRLAGRIEGLHLLGEGGTWSVLPLDSEGAAGTGPRVCLAGWSFPRDQHWQSPLAAPAPATDPDCTTFGLLHCHLGGSRSPYAPITAAELRATGYERWFLGHEHIPGDPATGDPFYLGSLTPLDPSETGVHGPVLVTVPAGGTAPTAERRALAPVRWEHVDLPCPPDALPDESLTHLLLDGALSLWRRIETDHPGLRAVGLRVRLTGQVDDPDAWDRACRALNLEDLKMDQGGTVVFIQKVESALRIRRDLSALAAGSDPAGLLARRILVLETTGEPVPGVDDPTAEAGRLVLAARARLEDVDRRPNFAAVRRQVTDGNPSPATDTDQVVREMLARVARRALDRLLVQKGGEREAV